MKRQRSALSLRESHGKRNKITASYFNALTYLLNHRFHDDVNFRNELYIDAAELWKMNIEDVERIVEGQEIVDISNPSHPISSVVFEELLHFQSDYFRKEEYSCRNTMDFDYMLFARILTCDIRLKEECKPLFLTLRLLYPHFSYLPLLYYVVIKANGCFQQCAIELTKFLWYGIATELAVISLCEIFDTEEIAFCEFADHYSEFVAQYDPFFITTTRHLLQIDERKIEHDLFLLVHGKAAQGLYFGDIMTEEVVWSVEDEEWQIELSPNGEIPKGYLDIISNVITIDTP